MPVTVMMEKILCGGAYSSDTNVLILRSFKCHGNTPPGLGSEVVLSWEAEEAGLLLFSCNSCEALPSTDYYRRETGRFQRGACSSITPS